MSCSPLDLKDYLFGVLTEAERRQVEEHARGCQACGEELDRLRLTEAALRSLPDEEPPRRIAFVSDKVFEPGWWQRFWQSGPRLGFASAALLAMAILVHGFLRPVPAAAPMVTGTAAIEARIGAAVAKAVAESEARQAQKTVQLVADTEKRLEFDRRADRVAFEEAFNHLQKKFNVLYTATADLGGRP